MNTKEFILFILLVIFIIICINLLGRIRKMETSIINYKGEKDNVVPEEVALDVDYACAVILYEELIDFIWYIESNRGEDDSCKNIGPYGEEGEYQIRPIFVEDVKRITKNRFIIDVNDNESCKKGIGIWLEYYSLKIPYWSKLELSQQYVLYNRGYAGFKKWANAHGVDKL